MTLWEPSLVETFYKCVKNLLIKNVVCIMLMHKLNLNEKQEILCSVQQPDFKCHTEL